jgi:hypothetical protein
MEDTEFLIEEVGLLQEFLFLELSTALRPLGIGAIRSAIE